ncbi:hypothetical protein LTR10_005111 [Elasticomyces elasticus]|nr:hypothetical protein LTR10_005111 [Elasticomyces elasticus]KAK4975851.1 hypothetical protein LTR42_003472 [Elasticomyces elasticus]
MTPTTQDVKIRNAYLDALKSGASQPDVRVHRNDLIDMLKHQQQVIDNLAVLGNGGRSGSKSKTTALAECRSSMRVMRSFLCRFMNHDPLKTLPSNRSQKAAERVFGIPELAEIILLELDTYSTLQAMQACTALAATIASPRIQIKLGLRAQSNSDWYSPFNHAQGDRSIGSQSVKSMILARLEGQLHRDYSELAEMSRFGERIQSMLICQPPITEMAIRVNCCRTASIDHARWQAERVKNSQGITLGDLLHATIQYQEKHQLCPHASHSHHDVVTGFVRVEVTFQGEVLLEQDDPVFEDDSSCFSDEGHTTPIHEPDEEDESWANLQDYMDYKQKAHQSGETIVTMAEFNRSN